MMIDVWDVENVQAQMEKAIALVSLMQEAADDYAQVKGPFKSGFEMVALNMSNVYDMLDKMNTDLDEAIDKAYKRPDKE